MERVPLTSPLSPMQHTVVLLLGLGYGYPRIAAELFVREGTVRFHANAAARKMPGDLPAQIRCIAWARGASLDVLVGDALRLEVVSVSQQYEHPVRVRPSRNRSNLAGTSSPNP